MMRGNQIIKGFIAGGSLLGLLALHLTVGLPDSIMGAEVAHAQGDFLIEASQWISALVTGILFISFLMYPLLGVLADPRFFLEIMQIGGASDSLHQIWLLSRGIMNVILAFMLIAGGAMTVVTAKRDIIMNHATKFILAVILVNFSWFFPRVILDVANVLSATIYRIPEITGTECRYTNLEGIEVACEVPTKFYYFENTKSFGRGTNEVDCPLPGIMCYEIETLSPETNVAFGMIGGLMLNHGKLKDLAKIPPFPKRVDLTGDPLAGFENTLSFIVHSLYVIIIAGMMGLILIAMVVLFIVRIVVLWLTMAFMPLMFTGFVFKLPGGFDGMDIFKHFVKAAFLPAVIAVPLTVGFVLINHLAVLPPPTTFKPLLDSAGLAMPFAPNLWQLLWQIVAVVVMWQGFFIVISKYDSFYGNMVKGIQDTGAAAGNIAKTLPLNVPILPIGKGVSLAGAKTGLQTQAGAFARGEALGGSVSSALGKNSGGGGGSSGSGGSGPGGISLRSNAGPILNGINPNNIATLPAAKVNDLVAKILQDMPKSKATQAQRHAEIRRFLSSWTGAQQKELIDKLGNRI